METDLNSLRETPPKMEIYKCIKPFKFSINKGAHRLLHIGNNIVASKYFFDKTHMDQDGLPQLEISKNVKFMDIYRPYNGQDLTDKTIIIWRTGGIGDILFIQPCMLYLKKKYPSCKIIFACSPIYKTLISNWRCIDKILDFPFDFNSFAKTDYHCMFEGVIERCHEARTTNSYVLFSRWMGLDIPKKELVPKLKVNKSISRKVAKIIRSIFKMCPKEYIYVQLMTSVPLRTPSLSVWKRILIPLLSQGHKIIFSDIPHRSKLIDMIIKELVPPEYIERVFNFSQYSCNLKYLTSVINHSKFVISGDSSGMHIAAGLNVPSYGIYGPFDGALRLSTYSKCNWVDTPYNSDTCEYGGHNCCLHMDTPCPVAGSNNTSPCFNNLSFTKINDDLKNLIK